MFFRKFKDYKDRETFLRDHFTTIIGELQINTLIAEGFLTAPASKKYHGNYEGGLFDHSMHVAGLLCQFTEDNHLLWKEGSADRSPMIVGLLHDLCKIDDYKLMLNETGDVIPGVYENNNKVIVKGHGMKSVIYAQSMGIRLSEEERACIIYHMGAFTPQEEWKDYTNAIHRYPNVVWTHHADCVATHVLEV